MAERKIRGIVTHVESHNKVTLYVIITYQDGKVVRSLTASYIDFTPQILSIGDEVEFTFGVYNEKLVGKNVKLVEESKYPNLLEFLNDNTRSIAGTAEILNFRFTEVTELAIKLGIHGSKDDIFVRLRQRGYDYIGKHGEKKVSYYFLRRNI